MQSEPNQTGLFQVQTNALNGGLHDRVEVPPSGETGSTRGSGGGKRKACKVRKREVRELQGKMAELEEKLAETDTMGSVERINERISEDWGEGRNRETRNEGRERSRQGAEEGEATG